MRSYLALAMLALLAGCSSVASTVFPPSDLTVPFADKTANLSSAGHQVIDQAVAQYRDGGPIVLTVIGHSDSRGSEYQNLLLSAQRAENVKVALVHGGIPPQNIQIQAYGISEPVSDDDPGAPVNRRVVIKW